MIPPSPEQNTNTGPSQVPHIRIVPHIVDVRHCLYFDVIDRDVPEDTVLKVGRFTDKTGPQSTRIAFKSKVVSRSHAEIWNENNQFFIKDIKSSSGTFLNHVRLSPPGVESRPFPLKDGDILQLGVDYQGGIKDIYKCVKIRLELNRDWQQKNSTEFRQQVLKNIKNSLFIAGNSSNNECCICLYQMSAFQALFVAPCSHSFHFKCVKQLLFTSSGFNCPVCRTYADLEANVEIDEEDIPDPTPLLQAKNLENADTNNIPSDDPDHTPAVNQDNPNDQQRIPENDDTQPISISLNHNQQPATSPNANSIPIQPNQPSPLNLPNLNTSNPSIVPQSLAAHLRSDVVPHSMPVSSEYLNTSEFDSSSNDSNSTPNIIPENLDP
ncbi:hypothetical protein BB560_005484, partial [Smittium megazygosporum]